MNNYFDVIGFLYKFKEGNLIASLAIQLFLLIVVLVDFEANLTAKIYSQSVKKIQHKRLFCKEYIGNLYFIFNKLISKLLILKLDF